ncbi:MAG: class I SAM-dependent methyltransferase, partial [Verrucomicrobia bacterium]|nr:class I SAM-dependent methyltransferase [Verrucomicrobiota bacterium]
MINSFDHPLIPGAVGQLLNPDLDPLLWPPARTDVVSDWYEHVPFGHWIVSVGKPRIVVELGTFTGVSYSAFCEAVLRNRLDSRCFAVDTWEGDVMTGYYGEEIFESFRRFHDERYASFSKLLRCTFDSALAQIPDASVDLLHLDGVYTYDAVRHDFDNWRPKLSKRGLVLMHGTNVGRENFGVHRFWEELQSPKFEFLGEHGLGILAIGRDAPLPVAELCRFREPSTIEKIRARFSLFGQRWADDRKWKEQEEILLGKVSQYEAHIQDLERGKTSFEEQKQAESGAGHDPVSTSSTFDAKTAQLQSELEEMRERDRQRERDRANMVARSAQRAANAREQ